MLLRHDWVTLYANGIRYLEKAPLYYWMMAASMKLFGVSTAATRMPLAGSVLGLTLLLEAFARRGLRSGAGGALRRVDCALKLRGCSSFRGSTCRMCWSARCLTWAVYCYWLTERTNAEDAELPPRNAEKAACWGFAAACALNVLSKGLIGIVFPVAIVGVHLLVTRGWRGAWARMRGLHPFSSTALFLTIAVPWHVLVALANPGHGDPGPLTRVHGALGGSVFQQTATCMAGRGSTSSTSRCTGT